MTQKQSKELSNEILVHKGANLSRNERQGKDIANILLTNLVLHLNEERRDLRSQVKRSEGGDLVVRLHLHHLLIPRALSVRKKIKKPTGFILYQMKINLNGTSRLSLHLMQTQMQTSRKTTTNYVSKEKNEPSVRNNIKHQVKSRVNLMDRELEVLQQPNFFSLEPTSNYSNRRFPDRVGSSLQWGSNIKGIVKGRENLINVRKPYKCAGTTSDKTGSIFLHQREKGESHTLSDRQQGSLYFFKLGGTKNEHMIRLSKEMWHYLLNRNMAITAEYLPSVLNTVADRESRKKPDSSQWLLHPKVFQAVSRLLGSPTINLSASRLFHQLPQCIAWHSDPYIQGTDAMIQNWNIGLPYAFAPFSMT